MLRDIPPGSRLGRYEIKSQIGVGGMGEVYLAQDTNLRRPVALKLLLARFTQDEDRLRRFEQEACAASALNHPNILTIYEVGSENDVRFIVTEFIDGVTLRYQMGHAPMRLGQALDIAAQAAAALATAHDAGIVHRDIKPENIMVRNDGYIKLLDFGLVKLTENSTAQQRLAGEPSTMIDTDPGILMGTVKYMSPEQARGFEVDGRTDIWSLGVVLYEMLTGRLPFNGASTTDILVSILQHAHSPLSLYATGIPAELDRIIALALAKQPEDRYQTSREFASDLKALWQELEFKAKYASLSHLERSGQEKVAGDDAGLETQLPRPTAVASSKKDLPRAGQSGKRRRSRKAIDSLAILPLVNVSDDESTEYFSDGITESIINNLSQLPRLRVMARSTVFRYRGEEVDPQEVGRELNVRAVMTGRVFHLDDNLIIKAELVDANDGSHLWGEQYNRKMADIFSVQQEISREISEKLRFKLTGEEQKRLARRATENPQAYQFYLRGRYCWNKRTPEGFKQSIEHFEEAIEIDPAYAAAYAGLADSYNMLGTYSALAPREAFPKAKAAAIRALEIDDMLAEAHTSLAYVENSYDWDWTGAELEFKRAIELNPSYATAHYWYAITHLTAMGKLNEAKAELTQARELDPLSLIIGTNLGWLSYFARQYDRAIEQYKKTIELDANFSVAYYKLGQAYERKNLREEAIAQYRKALTLSGSSPGIMSALGHACAQSGKQDEARHVLGELIEMSKQRYVSPYFMAEVYRGLGELEQTFEWLEKAVADRSDWLVWIGVEPAFDDLRSDSRFLSLLRRIGLASTQAQPVLNISVQSLEQLSNTTGESESPVNVAPSAHIPADIAPPSDVADDAANIVAGAVAAIRSHNAETIEIEGPSLPVENSRKRAPRPARKRSSRKAIDSLAILPLTNASADATAEYLSDGITESIINTLSRLPKLRVMARSTVFRYRNRDADPQEVGRELGVRAVLTGRVLQVSGKLIIRVELVNVADGTHLWGEQYDRDHADIFEIQEEIAREISDNLRISLTPEEKKQLARRHTENPEAYRLYLKGRYHWSKYTKEGIKKGIEFFNQAIELDPSYALAHAGLADSYYRLSNLHIPAMEAMPIAKAAAARALELDDTLADAHTSAALIQFYFDWNWHGAEKSYRRAIEISPNNATAHQRYSMFLMYMGRFDESLTELERAIELDPLSLQINMNFGTLFLFWRRYELAVEHYRKTLEMEPDYYPARFGVGWVCNGTGKFTEAVTEFQKALQLNDTAELKAGLGYAYGMVGKREEAEKAFAELQEFSRDNHVAPHLMAEICLSLNDPAQALDWLEKSYQGRDEWVVSLHVNPVYDSLRSEPRFIDMMRRLNFPH